MLIARYEIAGAEHYGLLEGETLRRLPDGPFGDLTPSAETDRLSDAVLLAPLKAPRVFAVGMNYVGHIKEAGAKTPVTPLFFMMPSTAVIGPGEAIVLPREAQKVEHECELTIVIGRQARRLSRADALSCVLGYTCANDVSERVIQNQEMANGALLIGKGFDSFCPLGPVIATGIDASALSIQTRVNGQLRQDGHTSDLLFDPAYIVSYLSQAVTLLPGDVILTGTPSGVGPLKPGDRCEITIEGIGTLANPVVAEV
ncbi:MAG: fumarylacetoacetate hydrolase family protein [Phenylobacterium sp.]|nr:fumarylacetoacetate hydrolase family protein [Phenylobacterium sp.]